ncbi:MAG: FecR family protein [Dysgonamonadaceae bacterium]|jgi:ferric-dicitrate binding protein FerR (iron transport regulator)|nr:FecR family protein [Dysgonamonadaceae bacterium]
MEKEYKQHIEDLIVRYLSETITEEEIAELFDWIKRDETNRDLFAGYKKIWLLSGTINFDKDRLEDGGYRTKLKIESVELNEKLDKARRYIKVIGYAASILLILGFSTFFYFYHFQFSSKSAMASLKNSVEVPYGSKSQVILPDGSKVWINAGSKINYNNDFGVSSREIYLEGEAYFDVVENKKVPFYVKTDLFKIKVYGTAFNVKSYPDDELAETTLDRGAISISSNNDPDKFINVIPNQTVVIHRPSVKKQMVSKSDVSSSPNSQDIKEDQGLNVEKNVNIKNITAWKDNRLVFDKEPLEILAKRLERRYNVTIHFADEKIKSYSYTAALKEMPVDQVFKAISMTSPIQYKIDGTQVTLSINRNFNYKVTK